MVAHTGRQPVGDSGTEACRCGTGRGTCRRQDTGTRNAGSGRRQHDRCAEQPDDTGEGTDSASTGRAEEELTRA